MLRKIEMYPCTQRTCKRMFRTQENADMHFCWNIVLPKSQRKTLTKSYTESKSKIVSKESQKILLNLARVKK